MAHSERQITIIDLICDDCGRKVNALSECLRCKKDLCFACIWEAGISVKKQETSEGWSIPLRQAPQLVHSVPVCRECLTEVALKLIRHLWQEVKSEYNPLVREVEAMGGRIRDILYER